MSSNRYALIALLVLLALPGIVAAQVGPGTGPDSGLSDGAAYGFGAVFSFGLSFVYVLIIGGIAAAISPDYINDIDRRVRKEPGMSLLFGAGVSIGLPIVLLIASILIITLIVTLPAMIVLGILLFFIQPIGVVAVGVAITRLADIDGIAPGVLVGAVLYATLAAVPLIGGLLTLPITLLGTGAICKKIYDDRQGDDDKAGSNQVDSTQGDNWEDDNDAGGGWDDATDDGGWGGDEGGDGGDNDW